MRYVNRDVKGRLIGHYEHPVVGKKVQEQAADDHPDIVEFDAKRKDLGPSLREILAKIDARLTALESK